MSGAVVMFRDFSAAVVPKAECLSDAVFSDAVLSDVVFSDAVFQ